MKWLLNVRRGIGFSTVLNEVYLELGGEVAVFAFVDPALGHLSFAVPWFRNYCF